MDKKYKIPFYIGAAIYMDFDSDEVDYLLKRAGLTVDQSSLEECRKVIRKAFFASPNRAMRPIPEIPPVDPFWGSTRLTATEAARKYNVPVTNVRRWAQNGGIAGATKVDNRWSFQEHQFVKRLETWRHRKPGSGQAGREVMNATEKEDE